MSLTKQIQGVVNVAPLNLFAVASSSLRIKEIHLGGWVNKVVVMQHLDCFCSPL